MATRIFSRSFSGGEITPELFGRLDLSKVQESLALCRNFITLPHGPVVNRPGTEYVEEVKNSANPTRLIPFSYNNMQSFAIQLGAGYFRFHSQGGTLHYPALAAYSNLLTYNPGDMCSSSGTNYYCLNSSSYNPVQAVWLGATAYNVGDLASDNGFTYLCAVANTGHRPSYSIPSNAYWTPLWYALPANGDYEIPNFYAATDLFNITYTQSADVITLCHQSYPILELRRYGTTNWQLRQVTFAPLIAMPTGSGAAGTPIAHVYGVQAMSVGFTSINGMLMPQLNASAIAPVTTPVGGSISNDITQTGAYNIVTWNGVAGAQWYNVYKQSGGIWYLLSQPQGLAFTDDASKTLSTTTAVSVSGSMAAPTGVTAAPFPASGNATALTATATVGTGSTVYSYVVTAVDEGGNESYQSNIAGCSNNLLTAGNFNTITIPPVAGAARYNVYKLSAGAWGFIGQATTPPSGPISFIDNYITPDISRTPPLVPSNLLNSTGNYPGAVAYYQQRRFFGGTASQVQNVWATRSGTESDMNYTLPSRDDNRLAFKIASREGSAIRHIVPLQDLLILSASCEWKCSSTTGVLTPSTLNVQPQSYIGANNVQPVVVGNAVLYGAARGGHIRQMNYNWQINGYQSTDISIFAPHLFDYHTIMDMTYSRGPIPILWCTSSSGKLLGMTYLPEQQIASWHQHTTGATDAPDWFESVCAVTENNEDILYCIVWRYINGATKRFVERMHTRYYSTVYDCHYVDCGATYNGAPTTTVSGLTWLNGMTVNILADGAVVPPQVVTGGAVTLPVAASQVHVGLPITAQLQTPPAAQQIDPAFAQGRPKNVNKAYLRVYRSSGILAGPDFADLTPYAQRKTENPGSPPNLVSDEVEIVLTTDWGQSGQICIQQSDPLPLDIASMTLEVAVGGGV